MLNKVPGLVLKSAAWIFTSQTLKLGYKPGAHPGSMLLRYENTPERMVTACNTTP